MKMVKKAGILLLVSVMAVNICACGSSEANDSKKEKSDVTTSDTSKEKTVDTREEAETEVAADEAVPKENELGLEESEMNMIYSVMRGTLQCYYLDPNGIDENNFTFPEDEDSWNYFAKCCMYWMENPEATVETVQNTFTGMYNMSSENATAMTYVAKGFYVILRDMDKLSVIEQFQMQPSSIDVAKNLIISNTFADGN